MKKILLYFKIRKFYKIFGEYIGSNFITKLSDMTYDNLYDVLFDINEVIGDEADEMHIWLDRLANDVVCFRNKKEVQNNGITF